MADIIVKKKSDPIKQGETKFIIDQGTNTLREIGLNENNEEYIISEQKLNTFDTYIIDGIAYKFTGDVDTSYQFTPGKLVEEDELYSVDPKEKVKRDTEFDKKLDQVSLHTKEFINSVNLPLSSFEVLLPLILDNYQYFNNNKSLNIWLKEHGYIKDTEVVKRDVTLDDATVFAGRLINLLNANGAKNILDFKSIFPNFDAELSAELSAKDILSRLRARGDIYTSDKDIAIKNFPVVYKDLGVSKALSSNILPLIKNSNLDNLLDSLDSIVEDNEVKRVINLCKKSEDYGDLITNLNSILMNIRAIDNEQVQSIGTALQQIADNYNINNVILVLEHIQNVINQIYLNDNSEEINKDLSNIRQVVLSKVELLYKNLGNLNKLYKEIVDMDTTKTTGANGSDTAGVLDISPKGWNRFILRNKEVNPILGEDVNAWEDLLSINFSGSDERNAIVSLLSSMKDNDLFKFKSLAYNLNREPVLRNLQKHFENELKRKYLSDVDLSNLKEDKKKLKTVLEELKELYIEISTQEKMPKGQSLADVIGNEMLSTSEQESSRDRFIQDYAFSIEKFLKKFSIFVEKNNLTFSITSVDTFIDLLKDDQELQDEAKKSLSTNYVKNLKNTLLTKFMPVIDDITKKYKVSDINKVVDTIKASANELVTYLMNQYMSLFDTIKEEPYTLGEEQEKQTEQKPPKYMERFQQNASLYDKIKAFFKFAATDTFSLDNLESVLQEITMTHKTNKNVRNDSYTEDTADMSKSSHIANELINFLNLNKLQKPTIENITRTIEDFLNDYREYPSVIPSNIDIDYIQLRKPVIVSIIYSTLLKDFMFFSEDSILSGMLKQNNNVNNALAKFDTTDLNQVYVNILKALNISEYDAAEYVKLYDDKIKNDPEFVNIVAGKDASVAYMTLYIANKLFEKYLTVISENTGDAAKTLTDYLTTQRFKLVTKLADKLSAGTSQAVFSQYQSDPNLKLASVDTVFTYLKGQYLYKYLSDNVVKSIANYKVLRNIQAQIYHAIKNNEYLQDSIKGTDIEFTDELVTSYLQKTGLYDLQFNVTKDASQVSMLKDVNVLKPYVNQYMYVNFNENPFRSLFNIINNAVNKFSMSRNALAMQHLLTSAGYTQSRIERVAEIMRNRLEAFIARYRVKRSESEAMQLKTTYEKALTDALESFKEIDTLANDQIKNIPQVSKIIGELTTEDPILRKYVAIRELSDKDRLTKVRSTKDLDAILPVTFELKYDEIDKYNASNKSDMKDITKFEEIDKSLLSAIDTINFKRQKLLVEATKEGESKSEETSEKIKSIDSLLTNMHNLHNSIIDKLSKAYDKNTYLSDAVVKSHIDKAKQSLYTQLISMIETSEECFNLTNKLSQQLSTLDELTNKIDLKTI
jgi:hypothetical protein